MDKHDVFRTDSLVSYVTLVKKMRTDLERIMISEDQCAAYRQGVVYERDAIDEAYDHVQKSIADIEQAIHAAQVSNDRER